MAAITMVLQNLSSIGLSILNSIYLVKFVEIPVKDTSLLRTIPLGGSIVRTSMSGQKLPCYEMSAIVSFQVFPPGEAAAWSWGQVLETEGKCWEVWAPAAPCDKIQFEGEPATSSELFPSPTPSHVYAMEPLDKGHFGTSNVLPFCPLRSIFFWYNYER